MAAGNTHPIHLNKLNEIEKAQRLLDEIKRKVDERRRKGEIHSERIGERTFVETTNPDYINRLKNHIRND